MKLFCVTFFDAERHVRLIVNGGRELFFWFHCCFLFALRVLLYNLSLDFPLSLCVCVCLSPQNGPLGLSLKVSVLERNALVEGQDSGMVYCLR